MQNKICNQQNSVTVNFLEEMFFTSALEEMDSNEHSDFRPNNHQVRGASSASQHDVGEQQE